MPLYHTGLCDVVYDGLAGREGVNEIITSAGPLPSANSETKLVC